jgi:hypothetical protein
VQVPDAQAHQLWCQASGSEQDCPVTVLLTGINRQLSQGIIIIYTMLNAANKHTKTDHSELE